jgi:hypothetical protein
MLKLLCSKLAGLVSYLERWVPALWPLYQVTDERDTPPTEEEMSIITGKQPLDHPSVAAYLDELITKTNAPRFKVQVSS